LEKEGNAGKKSSKGFGIVMSKEWRGINESGRVNERN